MEAVGRVTSCGPWWPLWLPLARSGAAPLGLGAGVEVAWGGQHSIFERTWSVGLPSEGHAWLTPEFVIGATSSFHFFIISWCLLSSHTQRNHIYWHHLRPNLCLSFPLNEVRWVLHGEAFGTQSSCHLQCEEDARWPCSTKAWAPICQPPRGPLHSGGQKGQRCGQRWDDQIFLSYMPGRTKGLTAESCVGECGYRFGKLWNAYIWYRLFGTHDFQT